MNFEGANVVVIGTKRSGLAAVKLLQQAGAHVRALSDQPLNDEESATFRSLNVEVGFQEREKWAIPTDIVVISPAVPVDLPLLSAGRGKGIPVIGEVELASYFLKGPVIGITGTNGKTTTTALTGHLLEQCKIPCQVGGNIGTAVASLVNESREGQWNVLELSSFQLETIYHFHVAAAACLNVTPDHLDRHHSFNKYVAAKARLFETQREGSTAVLNYDDKICRTYPCHTKGEVFWFSSTQRVPVGIWLDGEYLVWHGQPFLRRTQLKIRGLHNVENVMAACLLANIAGAEVPDIARAVETFPGVEHRLEFVRSLHGVEYYNDSKATNVDSTQKAIDAFKEHLWIILGGKDKDSDYRPLRETLAQKAKAVLLIGAAAPIIRNHLDGALPLVDAGTLKEAVQLAHQRAEAGDVVLLAPACASFDQFENYEHRGQVFKQLVKDLS
jgi:UDP-N-acetylmuramoylalanine--D-glutamate ligase